MGGAFDRATQAAIDMAASGFGEAEQNAVQLGKALQDPIKGITALARSGVTFTNQEKEKIRVLVESGRILEAQNTILSAIETQVGGTAAATANASDRMREGMRVVKEEIGRGLAPAFEGLAEIAVKFGTWAEQNGPIVAAFAAAVGLTTVAITAVKAAMAVATAASAAYALAQTGLAAANLAVQASTVVGIATAVAAAATIVVLTKKVYDNAAANREAAKAALENERAQNALYGVFGKLDQVLDAWNMAKTEAIAKEKAQAEAAEDAAAAEKSRYDALKENLRTAKDALRAYVDQVSQAITKEVSLANAFSEAATTQREAQERLQSALADRASAYQDLNQAQRANDQNAYSAALRRVAEAERQVRDAQAAPARNYAAIFREQIAAARQFAGYVKELVKNGLGRAGLAQILDLGPVAGAQVAKDLLSGAGGLTISGLNADLAAIAAESTAAGMAIPGVSETLGARLGRSGANQYYITVNAGVGDKNEIGRQVVEILQQYEKRVGALPIKVRGGR